MEHITQLWELICSQQEENLWIAFFQTKDNPEFLKELKLHLIEAYKEGKEFYYEAAAVREYIDRLNVNRKAQETIQDSVELNTIVNNTIADSELKLYGIHSLILGNTEKIELSVLLHDDGKCIKNTYSSGELKITYTEDQIQLEIRGYISDINQFTTYAPIVSKLMETNILKEYMDSSEEFEGINKFRIWIKELHKFLNDSAHEILREIKKIKWNQLLSLGSFELGNKEAKRDGLTYLKVYSVVKGKASCRYHKLKGKILGFSSYFETKVIEYNAKNVDSLFDLVSHLI